MDQFIKKLHTRFMNEAKKYICITSLSTKTVFGYD